MLQYLPKVNTIANLTEFPIKIILDYMALSSGQFGLVLVYMFQIMALFQWTVRQSAEVENLVKILIFIFISSYLALFKITHELN